jgi:hypothetical protein
VNGPSAQRLAVAVSKPGLRLALITLCNLSARLCVLPHLRRVNAIRMLVFRMCGTRIRGRCVEAPYVPDVLVVVGLTLSLFLPLLVLVVQLGCGSGFTRRNVRCLSSLGVFVDDSFCNSATRPANSAACSLPPCLTHSWTTST